MLNGAIIGYGGMAQWHYGATQKLEGISYTGVYDTADNRNGLAREAGLKVYNSPEEIYGDAAIDFILVATPNDYHKEYIINSLKAGKHVISEKPVTMNAGELIEAMAVAKETGKIFTVHQNRRWDEDYCTVKKAVRDNLIGKPYYYESRVQGSRGMYGDWRTVKEAGGGIMLDWGVHLIDQLLDLIDGKVVSVFAHMLSVKYKDIDDNFKLLMRFEDGTSAMVEVDTNCFIGLPRWHVSGIDGTLVVDDFQGNGKYVKAAEGVELKFDEFIIKTTAGTTRTMAPRPPESLETFTLPKVSPEWTEYYENFISHLNGSEPLLVTAEQALRVMKIMDMAFESERIGKSIECSI